MRTKIYLIPGTMCNERLWDKLYSAIGSSFELVHTPIPCESSLDEIADSLCEVFQEEKVNIVGFSLGGYIASYFAAKYPNRVEKIFVISNSPCALNSHEVRQHQAVIKLLDSYGYKGISRKKAASLLDKKNQNDNLISTIMEMDVELGEEVFKSQMQWTSTREDLFQELSKLTVPMTFFYSIEDPLVNESWLLHLSKVSETCVAVPTSGSGHMLPLEKPLELSEQIEEWAKL